LRPDRLRIGGFIPFSTVDYPGRLSAVLFCQGCPWRCRYCHNPHLQPFTRGAVAWETFAGFLGSRRRFLDAVVFSGGEPTAQPALVAALRFARELGFETALHTAGIHPARLREALPWVDWVGLDIKAPFDARYDAVTRVAASADPVRESLEILLASGVAFEVRTTVHPALLNDRACREIEELLARVGAPAPRWQTFRPQGCADEELLGHRDIA
jgi:anaerobic ribonucleoside-triphosphate reductase activating protein